jgi:uroporphyrin-III C-methyltransferase
MMNEDSGDRYRADADESRPTDGSSLDSVPEASRSSDAFETRTADSASERDGSVAASRVGSVGGHATGDRVSGGSADDIIGPTAESGSVGASAAGGKVYLVGSGPGDPMLLTRKAWSLLEDADFVLHDSLVSDDLLDQLSASVEVVDVGKRPPDRTSQAEINDMLVELARDGAAVVRLKGGDPHVFGRGGEEAQYLADADVPFEVVPGVSSAVAAPGVAGIPLTHRDCASSVTVITGHETPDKDESALDWDALADTVVSGGTLVVLMGVRRLSNNVAALREHGVPAETPVAMVQKATWRDEQTVSGTLATIEAEKEAAEVEPPAVTIIGDVVGVRGDTNEWLDR